MYAENLATKGILGGTTATKGFVVLEVTEIPIKKKRAGDFFPTERYERNKKIIKVRFIYNNKVYQDYKLVDKNIRVGIKNIDVEIIDSRPIIKIKMR